MKTPALVLLLVASYGLLTAQTAEIDSLIQNLERYQKQDSLRARLLLNLAIKIRRVDPTIAQTYYKEAYEVAEIAGEGEIQANARNGMAICYGMLGRYSEAIEMFRSAIDVSSRYGVLLRLADSYNGLGIVYKRLGDYPQSLSYYSLALPIYDSLKDYRGLGAAFENVGILYDLMSEPGEAMKYYQKAIAIYDREEEPLLSAFAMQNVAVLLTAQKKYDEALHIFVKNMHLYDSMQRHPNTIANAGNIGYILIKQKKYAEAKAILLPYLEKARQYKIKQEEASILDNLFKIAMVERKFSLAAELANDYQRLARELGSREYLKTSYALLSELYEKKGDYASALDAFRQHKAWSDSLFNEANARAFQAHEVKIEVLEKNKQLAEQILRLAFLSDQVKQETTTKRVMAFAVILLFAIAVLLFQKFKGRKKVTELLAAKNDEITRQNLKIEQINYHLENRMLRAQINPHFIFNSLSSIQHLIALNDKRSSLKYLSRLSNLLRHILESSISGNVLLKEEIRLLSMYLELESLRFNGEFQFSIHVDPELDIEALEMPAMILQPLIENAVLHGLMPKPDDRRLEISFKLEHNVTEIRIQDNGIGRNASQMLQAGKRKAGPSRGVGVTEQRLASLNEKYGAPIEMKYHDLVDDDGKSSGTLVVLRMPLAAGV